MIMSVPISMSYLEAINLIFTILNMTVFGLDDFGFLFFFMFYVGYIGGSIYLNTFYIITQKRRKEIYTETRGPLPKVAFEDQEIAINLALIGMDLGYTFSACSGLILDTIMHYS